jgi:hypothetical protein
VRHEGTVKGRVREEADAIGPIRPIRPIRSPLHSHAGTPPKLKRAFPFCACLRLLFSNLYQISGHFHGLQPGFTAHFSPFPGKYAQVPFYEELTTNFARPQSNPVKPSQSKKG